MKLKRLLKNIKNYEIVGNEAVEITGLSCTHTSVKKNDLFFCIDGYSVDGHKFARAAVDAGAVALVCNKRVEVNVPQVIVENVREAMSLIAGMFYANPADKLKIIGVTGTNGKTTTCHVIKSILSYAGNKVGLIGTLGIFYLGVEIAPELTTPDPIFLHKIFADMVKAGIEYVVMEVSAHAVELKKLEGIRFEVGVFTNLTQDHLDFFKDMREYGNAKAKFLTDNYCDFTVINSDDAFGKDIHLKRDKKSISYGIDEPCEVFAVNVKETVGGISFVINILDNVYRIECCMVGKFNVYNCLAAATCCAVLGVDLDDIVDGIAYMSGVNGRVELVNNEQGKKVFVDYAHTPDGLKNVLVTLKRCAKGRLICLFGCGGNRDRDKRAKMGEIAGEYADFTIVTSDNPRYEDPCDIIREIEVGVRKKTREYITVQDRRRAIDYALEMMTEGDVLLIGGKGAEDYQEILGVRHDFNDKKYVTERLCRENQS